MPFSKWVLAELQRRFSATFSLAGFLVSTYGRIGVPAKGSALKVLLLIIGKGVGLK